MVVAVGRQRRPRRRRTPGAHGLRPQRLPRPATAARPRPRSRGQAAPGPARRPCERRSARFEQVNLVLGVNGPDPHRRRAASRSACSTPRSAAARRRGCSRRCASTAAWPTRSTPSPPTTPTPAWSGSRSGCLPGKYDEVLETVRGELAEGRGRRHHRGGARARQGPARGGLVLGLEDSGSRMSRHRQGRAGLRRAAHHRRGDRPHRRRDPRRRARAGARRCSPSPRCWRSSGPRSSRRGLSLRDEPDDRGSLLLHDADPEAAALEVLGGLLDDVGHQLGRAAS